MEMDKLTSGLPVIKTARDLNAINQAVKEGFIPIFRKVEPDPKIRTKYAVVRDTSTGEYRRLGDYRVKRFSDETVIDWTFHYSYQFNSPFAAYLVPKDLAPGTRVLLEDLIEDYIAASWNQGDVYRLASCEAIWDGKDMVIDYQPKRDRSDFVG
jgi:hypothetical protein